MVAIVCGILPFWLTSCGSIEKPKHDDLRKAAAVDRVMKSWVGHYESELVAVWGAPTKVEQSDTRGRTLIYESLKGAWGDERDVRIVGGGTYMTESPQPGYAARRIFYVNKEGVIYSYKWSGL